MDAQVEGGGEAAPRDERHVGGNWFILIGAPVAALFLLAAAWVLYQHQAAPRDDLRHPPPRRVAG